MKTNDFQLSEKQQNFLNFLPDDFDLKVIEHFNKLRQGLDTSLFIKIGEYIALYYDQTSIEISDEDTLDDNEIFIESLIKRFPTLEY
jgi:hypothetical protein